MKKIMFDNYRFTCGVISVTCKKNDCNAFHYNLKVELTLDEQGRLAVSGKIKSRIYVLGYNRNNDIFIDEKIPFNDTIPSHVQKRLDGMGCEKVTRSCNVKIQIDQFEKEIIESCMWSYNNKVKSEEREIAFNDFKARKEQFMKEFKELKDKFGINVILNQCVDGDYGTVDTDIIIRDTKYKDGYIEDWVEVNTMFEE